MLKIKFDKSHLKDGTYIAELRPVLDRMARLPGFTPLATEVAAAQAKLQTLETAGVDFTLAEALARSRLILRGEARESAQELMQRVIHAAEGLQLSEAEYKEAGLELRARRRAVGQMPRVQKVSATGGDRPGEADCHWEPIKRGVEVYIGEYATSANGPYTQGYLGKASKCTFVGLVSGTEYWFRVCAQGTAGPGPWSNPARCRAA